VNIETTVVLMWFNLRQGLLAAQKDEECRELVAKLHHQQMDALLQRDMLHSLIQEKVDVQVDAGVVWAGTSHFISLSDTVELKC